MASVIRQLLRTESAATPALDALREHDRRRAEVAAEHRRLAQLDGDAVAVLNQALAARAAVETACQLHVQARAAEQLGEAADVAGARALVAEARSALANLEERASVSAAIRTRLAPKIKEAHDHLIQLDALRPDLERAAELEAAAALLPAYAEAQARFVDLWLQVHARTLRADAARVVSRPLGSAVAVRDIVVPVPFAPEFESVVLDRDDLFRRLRDLAQVPAGELGSK